MPFGEMDSSNLSMDAMGLELKQDKMCENKEISDEEALNERMKQFEQEQKKEKGFFKKLGKKG